MQADNPFSEAFLIRYPIEAARVLEQVSARHVAALLNQLPVSTGAPVMAALLPGVAADCLHLMDHAHATKLMAEIPLNNAARIYRLMATEQQDVLSSHLPEKLQGRLRQYLRYPVSSAGAVMDPNVDILPGNISVSDAIRRLERFGHPAPCEIFVADDKHHLLGSIEIGKLLAVTHHDRLTDVINRKPRAVSVHASIESLMTHPGWKTHRALPVVERDHTLVGALYFSQLQDLAGTLGATHTYDPMNGLLSLASLYWISLSQLLDSLMSISQANQEKQP